MLSCALGACIEHARRQKKTLRGSEAAVDLAVEDIEFGEAGDSREVATPGPAHRHVAMQKKADKDTMATGPTPTRRALRAASAQARPVKEETRHKTSPGPYNYTSTFYQAGGIKVAEHSERLGAHAAKPAPSTDQRSPIYYHPSSDQTGYA